MHSTVLELWREEHVSDEPEANRATSTHDVAAATADNGQFHLSLPLWKRVLDVTFILLTSPVWLPLVLLVMLAVRLSSPGPIFYRQERIGFRGGRFMIYKFRSMKVDAETDVHEAHLERLMRDSVPMAKLDGHGDPRIFPWGRILRATGLDELPQIFNVLRGEMSLVGPRPCTVHEFSRYANWQRERVKAFPGMTGYWQVNGKNKTTFNEMIEMDIYYAKNLSLFLDLKIILQTVPALVVQTMESISRRPRGSAPTPVNSEIKSSQI
ncbi:MAG: sugar transferase [Chthoniobacterales bacterium]